MIDRKRLPVVGVMGSGEDEHMPFTEELGRWLARLPVHLLTGGGNGVMAAVARGFTAVEGRMGLSIGILPCRMDDKGSLPVDYPNAFVELPIRTHLQAKDDEPGWPDSRNHINVLTSTAIIALPGGAGTANEIELALHYRRPIIGYRRADGLGIEVTDSLARLGEFLARHGIGG